MAAATPIPSAWSAEDAAAACAASGAAGLSVNQLGQGSQDQGLGGSQPRCSPRSRRQRRSPLVRSWVEQGGEPLVPGHGLCSQSRLGGPSRSGQRARGARELLDAGYRTS